MLRRHHHARFLVTALFFIISGAPRRRITLIIIIIYNTASLHFTPLYALSQFSHTDYATAGDIRDALSPFLASCLRHYILLRRHIET